jgi:hypothetical protein
MNYLKRAIARNSIRKVGLWFVDIPRTGSTSVKKSLGDIYGGEYRKGWERETDKKIRSNFFSDHKDAQYMKKSLSPKIWDELFSFSIVRNPWDRFLSLYRFRQASREIDKGLDFKSYVLSLKNVRYRDKNSPFCAPHYHMSMSDFLLDNSNNLLVKKVFLFEERSSFIDELSETMNLNLADFHKETLSCGKSYKEFYDDESSSVINDFYADDIVNFNYKF